MLSKRVNVTVFGTLIGQTLYSGYLSGECAGNTGAYFVSRKRVTGDSVSGIVVAVVTLADGTEKLIAAPEGEIYYEPELLSILAKLKNIKVTDIKCLYEKSCGGLVFYKARQGAKVLLVKNNNGRYWSFPKGHIEKGETEKQTAIREIKEETGLDVQIVDGFREVSDYCPFGKIRKRVVFFLAQTFSDNVKIQESEIDSFIWVDLQQARKKCSYDNDLRVLDKAEIYINKYLK